MKHTDPDYNRAAEQPRAGKGGEVGPNGEFYKGGAFIATQADKPKGVQVVNGAVELDGKVVSPRQRKVVFAHFQSLGLHCEYSKDEALFSFAWDLYQTQDNAKRRLYTPADLLTHDLWDCGPVFQRRVADFAQFVAEAQAEVDARDAYLAANGTENQYGWYLAGLEVHDGILGWTSEQAYPKTR